MSNDNLIPIKKLRPFGRFCCTIGNLPTSYMLSLTYEEQLLWLCNYLEKTVIPAINNNAEAVAEIQDLFIKLKNYVDDYFTNLNVQKQINKKLDEMAEDGTLAKIINQDIFNELNTKVDTNTENINNNTLDISNLTTLVNTNISDISSLKTKVNKNTSDISTLNNKLLNIKNSTAFNKMYQLIKPEGFNSGLYDMLKIYYNNHIFSYFIDIKSLKHASQNTWYISPNGKDSNPGTEDSPKKSIDNTLTDPNFKSWDTIVLLDGIYHYTNTKFVVNRNCNIVAKNPRKSCTLYVFPCYVD